jgi:hypothetical protein
MARDARADRGRWNSWGVRRLAEHFADSAALARSSPSRWRLEVMIRDHASTVQTETGALQGLLGLLDPLLQLWGSSLEPDNAAACLRTRLGAFQKQTRALPEQAARNLANPHSEEVTP